MYRQAVLAQCTGASAHLVRVLSTHTDPHQRGMRWAIAHANLADPFDISALLDVLTRAGDMHAIKMLMNRDPVLHVDLANPSGAAYFLKQLHAAEQKGAVDALAARSAAYVTLTQAEGLAFLLKELDDSGQKQALKTLKGRMKETGQNSIFFRMEEEFRSEQREELEALMGENPIDYNQRNELVGIAHFVEMLGNEDKKHVAESLMGRDPAAHRDLEDSSDTTFLIEKFRYFEQQREIKELANLSPIQESLAQSSDIIALLEEIDLSEEPDTVERVVRDIAGYMDVSRPDGIVSLLIELERWGVPDVAERLAVRVAAHVTLVQIEGIVSLLEYLKKAGYRREYKILTGRAADRINLDRPDNIVPILRVLDDVDRLQVIKALVARDLVGKINIPFSGGVSSLLEMLRRSGEMRAVRELEERALNSGFLHPLPELIRCYGRELDGRAAPSWAWDDL